MVNENTLYNELVDDDYESCLDHSVHRSNEGLDKSGCLLGVKETFYRLKKSSL